MRRGRFRVSYSFYILRSPFSSSFVLQYFTQKFASVSHSSRVRSCLPHPLFSTSRLYNLSNHISPSPPPQIPQKKQSVVRLQCVKAGWKQISDRESLGCNCSGLRHYILSACVTLYKDVLLLEQYGGFFLHVTSFARIFFWLMSQNSSHQ